MKHAPYSVLLVLAASVAGLSGCKRSLDEADVREFVDHADDAARKRYAPEICELRGEHFTLELSYQVGRGGPLAWLTDVFFARSQVTGSLRRSLAEFRADVEARD